jgi:hypothetical protein
MTQFRPEEFFPFRGTARYNAGFVKVFGRPDALQSVTQWHSALGLQEDNQEDLRQMLCS